ncbi:hypothetical protein KAURM247S_06210 [Kitasatospora aureofaciens]
MVRIPIAGEGEPERRVHAFLMEYVHLLPEVAGLFVLITDVVAVEAVRVRVVVDDGPARAAACGGTLVGAATEFGRSQGLAVPEILTQTLTESVTGIAVGVHTDDVEGRRARRTGIRRPPRRRTTARNLAAKRSRDAGGFAAAAGSPAGGRLLFQYFEDLDREGHHDVRAVDVHARPPGAPVHPPSGEAPGTSPPLPPSQKTRRRRGCTAPTSTSPRATAVPVTGGPAADRLVPSTAHQCLRRLL